MIKTIQKNNLNSLLFVLLICVVSSTGCSKIKAKLSKKAPAVQPQQNAGAVPVQKKVSAAQLPIQQKASSIKLPPPVGNQFDFSTKKDPFKPHVMLKATNAKEMAGGKIPKAALPIHSFDVNQFRLIGVITDVKGNKAMVVDPNGKGYVLKEGMTIGKNEGKVVKISPLGFDVIEQFRDDNGKIRKETINVLLPKKQ